MDLVRVGDKVISRDRIYRVVDRLLDLRAGGFSQQEVAEQLGVDRTLVSRLESVGEIRKGARVAIIGFPVRNREELEQVAREEGVDYAFLLNDEERWDFVNQRSGARLLNEVMEVITRAQHCDAVIFLGSDMRLRLAEAILGPKVICLDLGASPITEDQFVDPAAVRALIRSVKG